MLDLSDIVAIIRLSWLLGMGIMIGFTASVLWRRHKSARGAPSIMTMLGMLRKKESAENVTSLLRVAAKISAAESEAAKSRLRKLLPLWIKSADYERLNWVNLVLRRIWPFLDVALCNTLNEVLPPVFESLVTDYGAPLIHLNFVSLGSVPPELGGVKVVKTAAEELILEIEVKCFTDPDVQGTVSKWGLSLQSEVTNILFGAHLRFTFKPLVPMLPCFGTIHLSLVKPYILKELLFSLFGWPEKLIVPIFDEQYFTRMQSRRAKAMMRVTLVEARGLRKMDLLALSDPFVEMNTRATRTVRSSIKRRTLDPVWDESFDLLVEDRGAPLRVKVLDYDKLGKSRFMGIALVDLMPLVPWEEADIWVDLSDDPKEGPTRPLGSVHLRLLYTPFKEGSSADVFSDDELAAVDEGAAVRSQSPLVCPGKPPPYVFEGSEDGGTPSEADLLAGLDPQMDSENSSITTSQRANGHRGEYPPGMGVIGAHSSSESLAAMDRASNGGPAGGSPSRAGVGSAGGGIPTGGSVASLGSNHMGAQRRLRVDLEEFAGAGALFVTLLRGKDLTPMDMNGKADPYVIMKLSGSSEIKRSKVCKKTLNPVWNETFEFMVNNPAREKLLVEVWDKDFLGKEFMGQVEVDLADVVRNGRVNDSWHLNDIKRGELLLELVWQAVA
eukprot:jgi/Mesvir1/13434/Mv16506-RA.3